MKEFKYYSHAIHSYHTLYRGDYSSVDQFKQLIGQSSIRAYIYWVLSDSYQEKWKKAGEIRRFKFLSEEEINRLPMEVQVSEDLRVKFVLSGITVEKCETTITPEKKVVGEPYVPSSAVTKVVETYSLANEDGTYNSYLEEVVLKLDVVPERR